MLLDISWFSSHPRQRDSDTDSLAQIRREQREVESTPGPETPQERCDLRAHDILQRNAPVVFFRKRGLPGGAAPARCHTFISLRSRNAWLPYGSVHRCKTHMLQ